MTSPLALAMMPSQATMGMTAPPPAPTPANANVQPTDVTQIYKNAYDQQMAAYNAKVAQKAAMYGGLAGIGGAGMNLVGSLWRGQGPSLMNSMGLGGTGSSSAAMPGVNASADVQGGSALAGDVGGTDVAGYAASGAGLPALDTAAAEGGTALAGDAAAAGGGEMLAGMSMSDLLPLALAFV